MELKFTHDNTKVEQLADFISRLISANEYKIGENLPSINVLSRRYNVSRDTVFKAFLSLKEKGIICSIHGKNYYVANPTKNILLLLDEYSPFKEALFNSLIEELPSDYKVDLWFHQYNKKFFDTIVNDANGKYAKYIVMNYDNEELSGVLGKIQADRLLLLDFGKFDKNGYSFVCQDFDGNFYDALVSLEGELRKYPKLVFVFNKKHKHPQSSKIFFDKFCGDYGFAHQIADGIISESSIEKGCLYIVIKPEDVVGLVKQGTAKKWRIGKDYGLIAYNESPFYEVIGEGITSLSVDFKEMGRLAANFVLTGNSVRDVLPTKIYRRNSI
ncbi:MAG: GntR family transcriptional regulator [Dysgonamonadaceae bacterium]|jgi:DNA-binding transcriptional regulator YhcF (GntR family)|nr:GntR family transcriptional regulator [Dysgonamonadaceae bacterium]